MKITQKLWLFLQGEENRGWLGSGELSIYVRKGPLIFNGRKGPGFTLASATASRVNNCHTGRLRPVMEWMDLILARGSVDLLKVENVMNPRIAEICGAHGWTPDVGMSFDDEGIPLVVGSFWKWRTDP